MKLLRFNYLCSTTSRSSSRKISAQLIGKMPDLQQQFEHLLGNSGNSPELSTAQPTIKICKPPEKKSDNKLYILICVIVVGLILFKYNDIIDLIFGSKKHSQIADELETDYEDDDEHSSCEDGVEEEKVQEEDMKFSRKKTANELSTKSNSRTYKKAKDPLFQEFE